ncbi:uncharacterized protein LOC130980640 [Arachis stenosperma]|uniref:uncharacterized protein LOC130980640 n=1 Tax=Arachis stenosperma TaxID=217475 RepID=UPI0025AD278D|nr:uncharacterized protein LOC130980640 [Arachis stenosperma]
MAEFVVLRDSMVYNVILGRIIINELLVFIYTKFLTIKFVADDGLVGTIWGDLEMVVAYNNARPLIEAIRANGDLFAWIPVDILGIDTDFMSHRLTVRADAHPVGQRRRKMSLERTNKVAEQMTSLLEANFIRELDYSTWLSNVVLVKKANGKRKMRVHYSDLNKACPKNAFSLPNIDALV